MLNKIAVVVLAVALAGPTMGSAQSLNGQGARQFSNALNSRGISAPTYSPRSPNSGQFGGAVAGATQKSVNRALEKKGADFVTRQVISRTAKAVVGRAIGAAGALKPETAYSN